MKIKRIREKEGESHPSRGNEDEITQRISRKAAASPDLLPRRHERQAIGSNCSVAGNRRGSGRGGRTAAAAAAADAREKEAALEGRY